MYRYCLLFFSLLLSLAVMSQNTHIVQRGESVSSIAKKYNVSIGALEEANPDIISFFYVGMSLSIPSEGRVMEERDKTNIDVGTVKEEKASVKSTIIAKPVTNASSNQKYKIGDYYNCNGLQGIVVRIDSSGEHGLIMSMERTSKRWVKGTKTDLSTNAFHEDDGEYNMEELQKYLDETGNTWDHFPLFEWARNLGDGWYIPALDELKDILLAINGGLGKYNPKIMKPIRKKIKKYNGDNLIDGGFYNSSFPCAMFSSTEGDAGKVMTLRFKPNGLSMLSSWGTPHGQFIIDNMPKQAVETGLYKIKYGSRAVHKF